MEAALKPLEGSQVTTFSNLTVNKASDTLTLAMNAIVSSALTLTKGIVKSSCTALVSLLASATTSGASNNSYVRGPVKKLNVKAAAFTFPVGDNGRLRSTTLSAATLAGDSYTAEYYLGHAQ